MTNPLLNKVSNEWQSIAAVFAVPQHEAEYLQRLEMLNELIDIVGDDESHPLASLLETLGVIVSAYEQTHHPVPDVSVADVLQYLMREHQLTQHDLPEIGNQAVVNEIISGKQQLNTNQIQALCTRFHLSFAVFFPSVS